jgi:hypothetical protein
MLCPYEESGQRYFRPWVPIGTGTGRGRWVRIDEEKVLARELNRRYERGNKWGASRVVLSGVAVDREKIEGTTLGNPAKL